jgi:hypothetical protein
MPGLLRGGGDKCNSVMAASPRLDRLVVVHPHHTKHDQVVVFSNGTTKGTRPTSFSRFCLSSSGLSPSSLVSLTGEEERRGCSLATEQAKTRWYLGGTVGGCTRPSASAP